MTRSSLSVSYFAFTALHLVCFALALTVCGLYGTDLQRAKHFDEYTNSKWVRKNRWRHTEGRRMAMEEQCTKHAVFPWLCSSIKGSSPRTEAQKSRKKKSN
jgi:hypothetical protein